MLRPALLRPNQIDLVRSKQYCLQLHTLWYHMMINVMCLQASQKSSEVPTYSVVDTSKKKNRKNGSTPAAAVRHFHFLNGVITECTK